jgi:hypothetical protein
MLSQFLDTLLSSGVLIPAIWIALGFATAWLLLSAKRSVALSSEEVEMLWKFHKQKARCYATKCTEIKRRGKIIGFKCECGHKHIQQKHIINVNV